MKILLVNKFWYKRGGAELVVFHTKKILEDAGHTVEIFGMKHRKNEIDNAFFSDFVDYDTKDFLQKIKNAIKTIYNREAKKKFEQLVKEFQPDVVHFHNIYHQLSFSLLSVTKKHKIPTVMTLHDYKMIHPNYTMFHHGKVDDTVYKDKYFRCLLNNCMESFSHSFIAMLEGWFRKALGYNKNIDVFLAPSIFMQEKMKEADYTNVRYVPNPVFLGDEVYVHTEGKNIVYVGRFSKEKGIDILLRVAEKTPEFSYVFIGDGEIREELDIYITLKKIKNVRITGWLEQKEIQKELQDARLVVVPSVWYENNPLSVLEAVRNGKLVLGSDIGGIPELLSPDILFRPGNVGDIKDAVEKWYTADEDVRKKKEKELFEELSKVYSFEEYKKRLEKVYKGLQK